MSFNLETALQIATQVHQGNKGRNGVDYIEILRQLDQKLAAAGADESTRISALLHNVLERSSEYNAEKLAALGCPSAIVAALELLAHFKDQEFIDNRSCELIAQAVPAEDATYQAREEEYLQYAAKIKTHPIARAVKIADLSFYLEDERALKAERRELKNKFRQEKYRKALDLLKADV